MQSNRRIIGITALLGAWSCVASAGPIVGTFNMNGTVTVTPTAITWTSDLGPGFLADMFTLSTGAGLYLNENGQNGVSNLNIGVEPVGSTFSPVTFITFNVDPSVSSLKVNYIYPGTASSAECTAAPAVGQHCTPANPGGSPFTFTNNNPPGSPQSSAEWVFTGITADGLNAWKADFTSQFNVPFQTVLQAFQPNGSQSVSNAFSATVTVSAIPEPGTLSMVFGGIGLLAIGTFARRRSRV